MSSFFFYGPPGTGKTTLASTFTKLSYHVHFIDIDRKVMTMKNLEPLVKTGKITCTQLQSSFLDDPLTKRVKLGPKAAIPHMPQGYTELTEIIDGLQTGDDLLNLKDPLGTVIVLDGMTRISQHMRRLLRWFKKGGDATFHDWDFVKLNYEELFDAFYSLQPNRFAHAVIIAHAQDERDEVVGTVERKPMMDGSSRDSAAGFVEECYYLSVDVQGNLVKFKIQTKPSGRIQQARSSRELPVFVDADMSIILKGEKYVPGPTGPKKA